MATRRQLESPPKRPRGFVPPRRPVAELPGDVEPERPFLLGPAGSSRGPKGGPPGSPPQASPRYRRDGNGIVWFLEPCPACQARGTLYFRVRMGNWRCHYCKGILLDADVTGEYEAVRAALEDAKGAVRRAQDHVGSDDRVQAAQLLQFAEGCCRRARFLVERYTAPPDRPGDPEARL